MSTVPPPDDVDFPPGNENGIIRRPGTRSGIFYDPEEKAEVHIFITHHRMEQALLR